MQFFRSFPCPPEVTEQDVDLIVSKYTDPDRPGLLNYLNLHHDITALGEERGASPEQRQEVTDYLAPQVNTNLHEKIITGYKCFKIDCFKYTLLVQVTFEISTIILFRVITGQLFHKILYNFCLLYCFRKNQCICTPNWSS